MIVPIVVAAIVASVAYLARLLTGAGAIAATAVGAAALSAGTGWVVLLLFFFASSNALSRWRSVDRDRLVGSFIEKGSRRDVWQVIANGGVFGIAALLSTSFDAFTWQAVGAGAIAAATADTWSTEVGTVLGGTPRHIRTGREVPPGTSGGITIAGSVATVAASVLVGFIAMSVDWMTPFVAVVAGGMLGSVSDSLLGATVQERRWCPACNAPTERRVHTCGTTTAHRGGISGCDNDVVNLLSTLAGAVVTWTLT